MKRRYERYYYPDDRDYPLLAGETRRKARTWAMPVVLDQGNTPHCVGYAVAGLLACQPYKQFLDPDGVYRIAQFLDEWEGEDYDGTSVRAGIKVAHWLGHIVEYQFTTSVDTAIWQIAERGSCVFGVNWYAGMDSPDLTGVIRAKGKLRGGHAILANGVNTSTGVFILTNSWGRNWGINGKCYLPFEDAAKLFSEDGEVVCGLEREVRVP